MRGGIAAILVVSAVLTTACDGRQAPSPFDTGEVEQSALYRAVERTRAMGKARTIMRFPAEVFPTVEGRGGVDFSADNSEMLFSILKDDGRRVPYRRFTQDGDVSEMALLLDGGDEDARAASKHPGFSGHIGGLGVLGLVARQAAELSPDDAGTRFRRAAPPPASAQTAIWIHSVEIDRQGRVKRIEFEVTNMAGLRTLTYYYRGETLPIDVPAADV